MAIKIGKDVLARLRVSPEIRSRAFSFHFITISPWKKIHKSTVQVKILCTREILLSTSNKRFYVAKRNVE